MNQPNNENPNCGNCRYWVRTQELGRGICAYGPPQMVPLGNGQIQVLHPPTPASLVCGRHEHSLIDPTPLPPEEKTVTIE